MATKCPECNSDLPSGASSCSKCGLVLVKPPAKFEDLTEERERRIIDGVSDRLTSNKKFLFKVGLSAFLWLFAVLGLLFGWGIWSAKEKLDALAARRFEALDRNMSNLVMEANARIVTNIAGQFEEPRIRKTVEDVAAKEAKAILEADVQPTVNRFRGDAEFLRLATRARAYDFKAYLQLLELQNSTNDLAHYAEEVILETDRSLERDRSQFMPRRAYMTYSGTNFYRGPFTSDELALRFPEMKDDKVAYNREGFVNTVGSLKEPLFLPSMMELLTNETDLAVADRLTIAISDLAKQDFHPRDFKRIQTWWHSRETGYTNWPFSSYKQGYAEFMSGKFADAARSFQEVLKVDPNADLSRALAIGSLVELGETNKAFDMAKGFNAPTGRWARWAEAKAELETGSVSNATVHFANLVRENPFLLLVPKEGLWFWRKIDWQSFHKLTSTRQP